MYFTKFKNLILNLSPLFVLLAISFISSYSFGAGLEDVIKSYNSNMMGSIGDKFLNSPLLSWNGQSSIVRLLFQITFLISFINAMQAIGQDMLMKLFDLALYMIIALALLGQPDAYKIFAPIFQFSSSQKTADGKRQAYTYQGNRSLDRDLYMYLSYAMDGIADQAFGADVQEKLLNASLQSGEFVDKVIESQLNCQPDVDVKVFQNCVRKFITASSQAEVEALKAEAKKQADEAEAKATDTINPGTLLTYYVKQLLGFIAKLYNPFAWFFPLLIWLFDLVRSAVNLFLLIGFGLMTAFSLFMAKIFIPFLLLPSQRAMVIKGLKIPLSTTMWGFLTSLIIFMSYTITESMTSAGKITMLEQINSSGSLNVSTLIGVLSSMFLTQLVIAAIQIVALFKVPKLAEDILNLSLSPVIGLGGELISASAGIVKMIGAVAMPAAAAAGSLAGSAMGAAKSGVVGAATGAIGEDKMNNIRAKVSSFTTKPPTSGGGIGGGGASLGNIASMKAASDSVKSGYQDYQDSRKNKQPAKDNKTDESSSGGGERTGLGKAIDFASAATKKAGSLAGKVGAEAGNMTVDAMTGNYSAMQNRVSSGLNDAAGSLIGGVNQAGEYLDSKKANIESRSKGASSAVFSRFQDSSQAQRAQVSASMSQALAQRELAGDEAKDFKAFSEKVNSGAELTSDDTQFMNTMQNVNLSDEQKNVMSQAVSRQYDDATQSNDFETMMKLSNNKLADKSILEKNRMNRENMDGYKQYFAAQEAKMSKLIKESTGKATNINTVKAQQELVNMVQAGLAKQSVMTQTSPENNISVAQNIKSQNRVDVNDQVDSLVNKENKSSADYMNLKRLSEDNKSVIDDSNVQTKINDQLSKINETANFKATPVDSNTVSIANNTKQSLNSGSILFDNAKFKSDSNGTGFETNTFTDAKGKTQPISKLSSEAVYAIREELKVYDKALSDYNKEIEKNPDSAQANQRDIDDIRESRNVLQKVLDSVENAKKRK